MSHMVIYRGVDGKPGYHQTDDIHDAVSFVEQMRNEEGVEHARIFRLEEVVFEYRPYYRVELTSSAALESGNGAAPALEGRPKPVGEVTSGSDSSSNGDADPFEVVDSDEATSNGNGSGDAAASATGSKRGLFGR